MRELFRLVTSLASTIGPEGNLLDPGAASCRQIVLPYPVIDNEDLAKLLSIDEDLRQVELPGTGIPGQPARGIDGIGHPRAHR